MDGRGKRPDGLLILMLVADIGTTTDAAIQQLAGMPQRRPRSWWRRSPRSHPPHREVPRPTYANWAHLTHAVFLFQFVSHLSQ
jgi:hypothetical protein